MAAIQAERRYEPVIERNPKEPVLPLNPIPQQRKQRRAQVNAKANRRRTGLGDNDQPDQPQHREQRLTEMKHDIRTAKLSQGVKRHLTSFQRARVDCDDIASRILSTYWPTVLLPTDD